jgi:hypothetical protein
LSVQPGPNNSREKIEKPKKKLSAKPSRRRRKMKKNPVTDCGEELCQRLENPRIERRPDRIAEKREARNAAAEEDGLNRNIPKKGKEEVKRRNHYEKRETQEEERDRARE